MFEFNNGSACLNETTTSCEHQADAAAYSINLLTLLVTNSLKLVFILSILLNTTTIISILMMKSFNQINLMIFNLALSDLVHTTSIPVFIKQTLEDKYIVSVLGCRLFFLVDFIGMSVSAFTVAALSVERYLVVCDDKKRIEQFSDKFKIFITLVFLGLVWAVAIMFPLPFVLSLSQNLKKGVVCYSYWAEDSIVTFFLFKFILIFLLPYTLIIFSSIILLSFLREWLKKINQNNFTVTYSIRKNSSMRQTLTELDDIEFHKSNKIVQCQKSTDSSSLVANSSFRCKRQSNANNYRAKIQRKSSRNVLLIACLFLVQWMPIWIMQIISTFSSNDINIKCLVLVTTLLTYTNSISNPIIYMLNTYNFKHFWKRLLNS